MPEGRDYRRSGMRHALLSFGIPRKTRAFPFEFGQARKDFTSRRNALVLASRRSRCAGPVAQWSEPAAHNRLVGGSSPPGPTTHSVSNGDFPEADEIRRVGGIEGGRLVSAKWQLKYRLRTRPFVSGLGNQFPRDTAQRGQRLGSMSSLLLGQPEHMALARPFGRQIDEAGDAHAVRQPAFDRRFHEI